MTGRFLFLAVIRRPVWQGYPAYGKPFRRRIKCTNAAASPRPAILADWIFNHPPAWINGRPLHIAVSGAPAGEVVEDVEVVVRLLARILVLNKGS
jgi:hypothetical protein